MSLSNVAVSGCELDFTSGVGASGGSLTINSTPSNTSTVDGCGIYSGNISVTVAGFSLADGSTQVAPVTMTISPTATYTNVDNNLVLREGDSGSAVGISYFNATTCVTTPETSFVVKIKCACQSYVTAE